MKNSLYSKKGIYKQVDLFRKSYEINYVFPLNMVEEIKKVKHIYYKTADFRDDEGNAVKLSGILCKIPNKDKYLIATHNELTPKQINFVIAHELGHFLLGGVPQINTYISDDGTVNQDNYTEYKANQFASELLMPYKIFIPLVSALLKNNTPPEKKFDLILTSLSGFFGVSEVMIKFRLNDLSYEIEQYLNGVSIDKINVLSRVKQLSAHIDVKPLASHLEMLKAFN